MGVHRASASLCRRVPEVTSEELRDMLREERLKVVQRYNHKMFATPSSKTTNFDLNMYKGATVKLTFWTDPLPMCEDVEQEDAEDTAAECVESFKTALVGKYGSLMTAWNEALDIDASGTLNYEEFLIACRNIGFTGSLRKIYNELDRDRGGQISVMELDPTCKIDCNKGRCFVCTLPNPCAYHDVEAQKACVT